MTDIDRAEFDRQLEELAESKKIRFIEAIESCRPAVSSYLELLFVAGLELAAEMHPLMETLHVQQRAYVVPQPTGHPFGGITLFMPGRAGGASFGFMAVLEASWDDVPARYLAIDCGNEAGDGARYVADADLSAAGVSVIRFTREDVLADPIECGLRVISALDPGHGDGLEGRGAGGNVVPFKRRLPPR